MAKYLDDTGLGIVWGKVKEEDATNLQAAKNYADGQDNAIKSRVSTLEGYFTSGVANEADKATKDGNGDNIVNTYVKKSQLGVATPSGANPSYIGVATLGTDGKVPSTQLPSFVDDVIEGYYYNDKFYSDSTHTTEITGEGGKIYVDLPTNTTYRWSGTQYTMISESISIGTTQGTAYDGAAGAQLASDVSALQTAMTTTIPSTYVPLNSSNSKGHIKNTTTYVELSFEDGTNGSSAIDLTNTITLTAADGSNISEIALLKSSIEIVAPDLKWKTTPNGTAKIIATTDQIPSVPVSDVKINNTSILSNGVADIKTNSAYNASSNKIATMNDVPVVEAITSQELAAILV